MKVDKIYIQKYLSLLEIEELAVSIRSLEKIVRAHIIKVSFENISKLLFKQRGMNDIPDLQTFLEGIEKYNFGGTCYTNNYYLHLLLKHIGFKVKLCGADMKSPDVHLINIVLIEGNEYIIDCGYAAPFFEPLPIYLKEDFIINFGNETYIVRPKDDYGRTKVEQYSNGKLQHWYSVNPNSRRIEEFRKVISESYLDDAVFMNAIRITRFKDNGSLVLKNLIFTETTGSESVSKKLEQNELPVFVCDKFEIPADLFHRALEGIKELKNIYD